VSTNGEWYDACEGLAFDCLLYGGRVHLRVDSTTGSISMSRFICPKRGANVRNFMAKMKAWIMDGETYYNEGWDAFVAGESPDDNPYDEGTYAFAQWEYGWTACEDEWNKNAVNF
jgi:hypothetical protein